MSNIIKPTVILALVAFFSALVLSHVNKVTEPRIAEQQKEKQRVALETVLPGYKVIEEKKAAVEGKEFLYWIGEKQIDEKTTAKAYAFIASGQGYSGEVKTMVGVDEKGTILAISIILQTETPGLGARSQEVASKRTLIDAIVGRVFQESPVPWFQQQFSGLDGNNKINIVKKGDWTPSMKDELIQKNAISAITGATITSRTVKESIEKGMNTLKGLETITPVEAEEKK